MTTTLTFRLDAVQRKKLQEKARLLGQSESQFLREILHRELEGGTLAKVAGKLRGSLSLASKTQNGWRETMRERNWRA